MPSVMDIKHLLCQPCDPCPPIVKEDVPYIQEFDFWKHARSMSTSSSRSSISSCSTESSGSLTGSPTQIRAPSPPLRRQRVISETYGRGTAWMRDDSLRRPRSASAAGHASVQTRTPWTPFEDDLLQQGYEQGLSWAMISSTYLPHRSRGCCWGRFKTLQNKNLINLKQNQQPRFCRRPWKAVDVSSKRSVPF
ncbi:uncharacterized protein BYT42DRAFT_610047 [Radiomyces spectabilis]|uniref:uncharacterized protein n=1 Tax=Radiomyces spectabilis TaxID=64574 RepID=UPI002220CC36|nr:uncharacterized protein BYT42DRAFT_610047 [Radiomyces spectabilis]KAI8394327.1 hypothetical protein BYT42DRAFT_610047 [Radiomyces spectabilis]